MMDEWDKLFMEMEASSWSAAINITFVHFMFALYIDVIKKTVMNDRIARKTVLYM